MLDVHAWTSWLGDRFAVLTNDVETPRANCSTGSVERRRGAPVSALSDLRASEARALIERIAPDLRLAGVPVGDRGLTGAAHWEDAVETIGAGFDALA